jgi:hypothetical protein
MGGTAGSSTTRLLVSSRQITDCAFAVQAITSQTGNLFEARNSSGVALTYIGKSGIVVVNGDTTTAAEGPLFVKGTSSGVYGTALTLDSTLQTGGHKYSFVATGPSAWGGAGDLAIYNSTTLNYVWRLDRDGRQQVGKDSTLGFLGQMTLAPRDASTKGLVVRNYSGQSAASLEIQDSSGNSITSMSGSGSLVSINSKTTTDVPLTINPIQATATITNVAISSGVATITTSAAHNFANGRMVVIASATPSGLNGRWTIISTPTSTTFTVSTTAGDSASASSGGTATSLTQTGYALAINDVNNTTGGLGSG